MKRLTTPILASAAAVILGCGGGDRSVAVDTQDLRNPPVYLALGDSIPFGFSSDALPPHNDNVFNAFAYPWYLAQLEDIPLVNAACEGQTSAGFITFGASDRGCFEFRDTYDAMHVDYARSQLEFAEDYLRTHTRVRFVTITLGADDAFLLVDGCLGDLGCIVAGLPGVLGTLAANMAEIFGALRAAPAEPVQIIVANLWLPKTPSA